MSRNSSQQNKAKKTPPEEHRAAARQRLKVGVITVSTSRYYNRVDGVEVKDESGDIIVQEGRRAGHTVMYRTLIPDDINMIRLKILEAASFQVDVIFITGGTGISKTDVTIEAVQPMLDKLLPGFGELFRMESYKQVGPAAMLSRAMLGSMNGIVIACLPGSPEGVNLGMKLLLGELPHIVHLSVGG